MPFKNVVLFLLTLTLGYPTAGFAQELLDTYYRTPSEKAKTTASGLSYEVLKKGKGKQRATETSIVIVHYTGWLASDGTKFDSSVDRALPATLPLNRVIKGWTEGVQLMRINELTRFWIPADLAYDNRPNAPMGDLVFDVHLLAIKPEPEPVKISVPPMTPPKKATLTDSGLAYQITRKGKGGRYPQPADTVVIHYTAWQASTAEMFDSTVSRGSPMPLPLHKAIEGLTEDTSDGRWSKNPFLDSS